MMKTYMRALVFSFLLMPAMALASEKAHIKHVDLDLSKAAVERGKKVFEEQCATCHGMKFSGYKPTMDPELAAQSFGTEPPDLSLMAKARGKRTAGAQYIYSLLVSYYTDEKGKNNNHVFPNIAMPNPGVTDENARDVAAFLWYSSEPSRDERTSLGKWVMAYLAVLTILLYVVNKRTWKDIKKKAA